MHESKNYSGWTAMFFPVLFLVGMWLIHWLVLEYGINVRPFAVHPRHADGLSGILTSPMIHSPSDMNHIINNSLPFGVLAWALFYFYRELAFKVLILIWLLVGMSVWIAGQPNSYHIGMSGVIYGLAGFLFLSGVLRWNKNLLAISMLVVFEYGSMVWGVLPLKDGVSWESHMFGGIAGFALAYYYRSRGPQRKKYQWEIEEELGINEPGDYWQTEDQRRGNNSDGIQITYQYKPNNEKGPSNDGPSL